MASFLDLSAQSHQSTNQYPDKIVEFISQNVVGENYMDIKPCWNTTLYEHPAPSYSGFISHS